MSLDELRCRLASYAMLSFFVLAPVAAHAAETPAIPNIVVQGARPVAKTERDLDPVVNNLELRTFRYFWRTAGRRNGLIPDRFPSESASSIAAIGFGLTAYVIGSERHYISRNSARIRTLRTLRFLASLPHGIDETGYAGYRGFFYHFLQMQDGLRFRRCEVSTVDTALLMAGVLLAQSYFDQNIRSEREIRELADLLYRKVEWSWAQLRSPAMFLGWRPESGFIPFDWHGYNEAMLMYILGLGSPTYPLSDGAWNAWTETYKDHWGTFEGQEFLSFGPMFGHQYSHVWIDFRGIQDEYMRSKGMDYFENSRRAAYAQRQYAKQNPMRWRGYDGEIWGLTASDGPVDMVHEFYGEERGFFSYTARGTAAPRVVDDGTIAPTAAVASIAFAPEIASPSIHAFRARYGEHLYQTFGFLDAVNPSFTFTDAPLRHGKVIENLGWVADDYLGIDQGPIIAMIENYRSGLVWNIMKRNPYVRRGLERAGFTGGWMTNTEPTPTPPITTAPR
ncbi:MAG TPA: glucoamylase family protein [Steroidobacteraceae bacterium]|nr:glucoamylase family protein [Steroidobacteraceae bacterium]